jgi:hypothetical protein
MVENVTDRVTSTLVKCSHHDTENHLPLVKVKWSVHELHVYCKLVRIDGENVGLQKVDYNNLVLQGHVQPMIDKSFFDHYECSWDYLIVLSFSY